jgi:hypothetical protein
VTGLRRGPWGVVLILANLPNAYLAYAALMIQPQGTWDEHTLTGIEVASRYPLPLGRGGCQSYPPPPGG